MRVYLYRQGLCDPGKNIGAARLLPTAKDVDDYINLFVASCKPEALYHWRAFVTNDTVDFSAVDHFSLFNEKIGLEFTGGNEVKEVNLFDVAKEVNERFKAMDKRRSEAKAAAVKAAKEKPPIDIEQLRKVNFDVV